MSCSDDSEAVDGDCQSIMTEYNITLLSDGDVDGEADDEPVANINTSPAFGVLVPNQAVQELNEVVVEIDEPNPAVPESSDVLIAETKDSSHWVKRKIDPIYDYFDEIVDSPLNRLCKLCKKVVVKSSGGLTNLYVHLAHNHKSVHNVCKSDQAKWKKIRAKSLTPNHPTTDARGETSGKILDKAASSRHSTLIDYQFTCKKVRLGQSPSATSLIANAQVLAKPAPLVPKLKVDLIDRNLLLMFSAPSFDFKLLTNDYFQKILKIACPSYAPPQNVVQLQEQLVAKAKLFGNLMRHELSGKQWFTLCLSVGSNIRKDKFLVVGASYIDLESGAVQSTNLSVAKLTKSSDEEDDADDDEVEKHLQKTLLEWELNEKHIALVVVGSEPCLREAARRLFRYSKPEVAVVSCFKVALLRVYEDCLAFLKNMPLTDRTITIYEFFCGAEKKENFKLLKLKSFEPLEESDQLGLLPFQVEFVATYSQDIHTALTALCEQPLGIGTSSAPDMLSPHDLCDLKHIQKALKFFHSAASEIKKMDHILATEVLNIVSCFLGEATDILRDCRDSTTAKEFCRHVVSCLEKSVGSRDKRFYALAAMMDPRYRNRCGLGPNERRMAMQHMEEEIRRNDMRGSQAESPKPDQPNGRVLSTLGSILKKQTEKLQFFQSSQANQVPSVSSIGMSTKLKAYFSDRDPTDDDDFWDYWSKCLNSPLIKLATKLRASSAVLCNPSDVSVFDEDEETRSATVFLSKLPPVFWEI